MPRTDFGNWETIVASIDDGLVRVTLNRPDRSNAMTNEMFGELEAVARAVDAEASARVMILTGAGRAFCAGFDLAFAEDLPTLGAIPAFRQQENAAHALQAIRNTRVPVIAAVNGAAAGGGFSLALAADIRIAARSAKFNAAFVRIGLSAGDLGVSWLLPRLVGPAIASEICFTGRIIEADEALQMRLVNRVCDDDDLERVTTELARQVCANSPGGVEISKRTLQANLEAASYKSALELENRGQALLTRTHDMAEALSAFVEKRSPEFTGA